MQQLWRKLVVAALGAVAVMAPIERASAQAEYIGSLSYNLGIPTGDTKEFTDNESWLGLTFEGNFMIRPNASAGIVIGWNEFHERTVDELVLNNGSISGGQYRHLNVFPLLVTGKYYFNGESSVTSAMTPFVGAGVGTYYVRQLFDIGTTEFTEDTWLFGVAPEIGVLFPLRSGTIGTLSARYNLPFSSSGFIGSESRSMQFFTIGLGIAFSR